MNSMGSSFFFVEKKEIRSRLRTPNLSQEQLLLLGRIGDHECSFLDLSSRLFVVRNMQIIQVLCLMSWLKLLPIFWPSTTALHASRFFNWELS